MSILNDVEIANPQHPHCATLLLLDTSGSMEGDKIRQLNEGLRLFKEEILQDELARKRVDLAIVTFGEGVNVVQNFCSVEESIDMEFTAGGLTPMGYALTTAMDLIEQRKSEYKAKGIDYYRPWIFMITDGEPTDMKPGDPKWNATINRLHEGEAGKRFLFFAVGVEPANMQLLKDLAPSNRPPLRLKKDRFRELFTWLSKSTRKTSTSKIGDVVTLENPTGPEGWGEIVTGETSTGDPKMAVSYPSL